MRGRWMDGSADVSSLPADLGALPPRTQQHGDVRAVHDGVPVEISSAGRTARPPCGNIGHGNRARTTARRRCLPWRTRMGSWKLSSSVERTLQPKCTNSNAVVHFRGFGVSPRPASGQHWRSIFFDVSESCACFSQLWGYCSMGSPLPDRPDRSSRVHGSRPSRFTCRYRVPSSR